VQFEKFDKKVALPSSVCNLLGRAIKSRRARIDVEVPLSIDIRAFQDKRAPL
jgi:hypothetical protein